MNKRYILFILALITLILLVLLYQFVKHRPSESFAVSQQHSTIVDDANMQRSPEIVEEVFTNSNETVSSRRDPSEIYKEQVLISERNKELVSLAENYNDNLRDVKAREELSEGIKADSAYKKAILEKFKSERLRAE